MKNKCEFAAALARLNLSATRDNNYRSILFSEDEYYAVKKALTICASPHKPMAETKREADDLAELLGRVPEVYRHMQFLRLKEGGYSFYAHEEPKYGQDVKIKGSGLTPQAAIRAALERIEG